MEKIDMQFLFFLKRQRTTLEKFIEINQIKSHEELVKTIKDLGLKVPPKEKIAYEFKKDVEERPVVKSNSKKKRVSNKKTSNTARSNSTSSRRSTSKQRVRKSSTQRKRTTKSDKVESVQPVSGSEDTK